ncbi:putative UDP-glucuronatexylan alpha-glucuronosyltransferase 3 [Nymphaea thermarum]|nr:putative UDP-glucuronatexylan alpha-glucuronosyltransferase 3 [Nymphaea thermarum]
MMMCFIIYSGSGEETNKRRFPRTKDVKDVDKSGHGPVQDRSSIYKFLSLKIVLVCIILCTCITVFFCPAVIYYDNPTGSSSRFVDVGWLWERTGTSAKYISDLNIDWIQVSTVLEKTIKLGGHQTVGLLNFNSSEVHEWQKILPGINFVSLSLEHVRSGVTWETLYPEWIDEEEESEVPSCPSMPMPEVQTRLRFSLIAVKLPCQKTAKNWSRDVARIHLQLAAAKLAASSPGNSINVLFMTDCWPLPNLFTCKELITHDGNMWIYKPDLNILQKKLRLPVGSCELSVPLKSQERFYHGNMRREAYATILHSAHIYVCGAIAAAQSIRFSGSTRDLVILVDETITEHHKSGLEAAGWQIRTIQRIRNPKAEQDAYNEWNYSKFRLWQLTDYDKIIFIDADLLILRNIDFLFEMPEITAIGNNATLFNSGVMVIEPSNCTFQLLMDHINDIESYNGGDQGYLNEIFTWWHRMPKHMNFLKHFWSSDPDEKELKTRLFAAEPPVLYVLHYLGLKPWLCFRDYDCNWNNDILHEFASDVAHERWWKVHDLMPENLQKFCLLRSKQKASLEWDRRQAEKANYANGHWKKNITDPRLKTCFEAFCFWESMLWHWGETNWTDNATATATPAIPTASLSSL